MYLLHTQQMEVPTMEVPFPIADFFFKVPHSTLKRKPDPNKQTKEGLRSFSANLRKHFFSTLNRRLVSIPLSLLLKSEDAPHLSQQ